MTQPIDIEAFYNVSDLTIFYDKLNKADRATVLQKLKVTELFSDVTMTSNGNAKTFLCKFTEVIPLRPITVIRTTREIYAKYGAYGGCEMTLDATKPMYLKEN